MVATVGVEGKLLDYKNRFLNKYFSKAKYVGSASFDADFLLLVRTPLVGAQPWLEVGWVEKDLELTKVWKLANNSYSLYRIR